MIKINDGILWTDHFQFFQMNLNSGWSQSVCYGLTQLHTPDRHEYSIAAVYEPQV